MRQFGRVSLLAIGAFVTLAMGQENDLDNWCSEWLNDTQCTTPPYYSNGECPDEVEPTEYYGLEFEVHHGYPGGINDEVWVEVRNLNENIRVRVRQYGTAYNTNIYFQNDDPEKSTCPPSCEFPDEPPCVSPPCGFSGECQGCGPNTNCDCHPWTCPGGTGCNTADCDYMREGGKTCGCEIAAHIPQILDVAQVPENPDSISHEWCRLPTGGDPNCDIVVQESPVDWCNYLSPSVDNGGVHFAIEELNFSPDDGCWYTLPNRIVIDQGVIMESQHPDCPTFDGSNPPRLCR